MKKLLAVLWLFPGLLAADTFDNNVTPVVTAPYDTTGNDLTLTGTAVGEFSGPISGNGALAKTGSGLWTLTDNNTYTGATTVSAGTLAIGADDRLYDYGDVSVYGGIFDLGEFDEKVGVARLFSGAITGSGTLTTTSGFDVRSGSISATLAGSGGLRKGDSGTVTLSGNNTYTGTTLILEGTLQLGDSGTVLSDNDAVSFSDYEGFFDVGTLALGAANETIGTLSGNVGIIELFNGAGRTLTVNQSSDETFSGVIQGIDGALVKNGSGTLTLTKRSTYTGGTTVNAGTLELQGTEFNMIGGALTIEAGATVNASGSVNNAHTLLAGLTLHGGTLTGSNPDSTYGNFVFNGDVTASGDTTSTISAASVYLNGARTFDVADGASAIDLNISSVLFEAGSLTKTGAGTLALSGANTYSGGTVVSAGTLVADHDTSVGSGAVLVSGGSFLVQSGVAIGNTVTLAGGSYARQLEAETSLANTIDATSGFAGGKPDTTASLLAGETSAATTLQSSFAATSGALNDGGRLSDVYSIDGVPLVVPATGETDLFVLELSIASTVENAYLGWLDPETDTWVNAIDGNFGNNLAFSNEPFEGGFAAFQSLYGTDFTDYIGAWGFSTEGGTKSTWAVLNHNSDFAIVPEPSTVGLVIFAGLGLIGRLARRHRLAGRAESRA